MKILLTGATGFLGSHILKALLITGHNVEILKRSTSNTWRIDDVLPSVTAHNIDEVSLESCFEGPAFDSIIHTACEYGRGDTSASKVFETNLLWSIQLLELASSHNACQFINTDSFFNNKQQVSKHLKAYSYSKYAFSEWFSVDYSPIHKVNMKLHHVYGPMDDPNKFIPWLTYEIINSASTIELSEGNQERDFIYVDDVVSAYLHCLDHSSHNESYQEYDVCTGTSNSLKTFIETLYSALQPHCKPPVPSLAFGKRPYAEGEIMSISCDNTALQSLGWKATINIEEGCKRLSQYESSKDSDLHR